MFDDEEIARKAKPALKPLEGLSIEELEEYIGSLQDEIARTQATIEKKRQHRGSAEKFFKK